MLRTGGRDGWTSKVLQEVLADLKRHRKVGKIKRKDDNIKRKVVYIKRKVRKIKRTF